jgi:Flp pilus assembly protein TadD
VDSATWLFIGLFVLAAAVGSVLWLTSARPPRRRRAYKRFQRFLHEGNWSGALEAVKELQELGPLSQFWDGRARNAEGECLRRAGDATLGDKKYEEALQHYVASAKLLGTSETDARERVIGTMLAEVRRLFAITTGSDTAPIRQLIDRIFKIQSPCPEAWFWQGLCYVRESLTDRAIESLRKAVEASGKAFVDPPLYLGAFLLRLGRPAEALRYLAEANRLEPSCPFVAWQLGLALVAANGDAGLAVRALQRALTPRGLPMWVKAPERAWTEGFPDPGRSFVPRLATQQRFVCPVFGSDVAAMARQGFFALSQAQYRLGNFQEAANICDNLLKEAAPTVPVLRGLGLALARLQRYDDAFKHLRAAFEMEEQKSPFTAGYLALCGAKGRPNQADDKAKNVAWAIRLLSKYHDEIVGSGQQAVGGERQAGGGQQALGGEKQADGSAHCPLPTAHVIEWADLCSTVFAEARSEQVPVAVEDVSRCCDVLGAVAAADAPAAGAYDHLAALQLDAIRPRHAWLYCRAAAEHSFRGQHDLDLFAIAFRQRADAEAFFAQRSWTFADVEFTYLQRWAEAHPGSFPDVFGPDYVSGGERLLLERSKRLEEAGQAEASLTSANVLLKLQPNSGAGHDRLAQLHFKQGDLDQAAQTLADWAARHPRDYRPLLRLALLQQQRGDVPGRTMALDGALALTSGPVRAEVAFLGARLALTNTSLASKDDGAATNGPAANLRDEFKEVFRYLAEALRARPDHTGALSLLAGVRWLAGDRAGLAGLARYLRRPDVADGRFQFLAAVSYLVAADYPSATASAQRAAADPALAVESQYVIGLAHLQNNDFAAAATALQVVGLAQDSPSAEHARALLGRLAFAERSCNDAVYWWQMLDAGKRTAWKFDEPLRGAMYLSALQAYQTGRYEQAAEQLRQAGRLGWRDRNLGPLLGLALFKEGQRRFYAIANNHTPRAQDGDGSAPALPADTANSHAAAADWQPAANYLEQAAKVGLKDANASYLLGLAHRRRGEIDEARAALRRINPPDPDVWLQLGLLSVNERQLAQAEQEFAQAWQLNGKSFAAGANLLLARLALGRSAEAAQLGPAIVGLAPNPEEWYLFTLLSAVLRGSQNGNGAPDDPVLTQMTAEDEQRLLTVMRGLGQLDTVNLLLQALTAARPASAGLKEAHFETMLLAGKRLLDRCDWSAAERLLNPLANERELPPATLAALFNLRGCVACLCQDFESGIRHFQAALRLAGADLAVHQNLALTHEWQGELEKAELHWNRWFDLVERRRATPGDHQKFWQQLAYEGFVRLATVYSEKERWQQSLYYLESAQRLRPDNVETLERLFHMYHQARRPDQARRALQQLQNLKPGEPQFELYELDLIDINELDDLERWLNDVSRILQRYQNDPRVADRSVTMLANAVSYMSRLSDQLTEQLNKVMKQVRSLDNYQINWSAVHDVMRDLRREFQKLRRLVSKCHALATHGDHRRILRDLAEHLDRKIDYCRRWQGD